jgi:hypothetical protein
MPYNLVEGEEAALNFMVEEKFYVCYYYYYYYYYSHYHLYVLYLQLYP